MNLQYLQDYILNNVHCAYEGRKKVNTECINEREEKLIILKARIQLTNIIESSKYS